MINTNRSKIFKNKGENMKTEILVVEDELRIQSIIKEFLVEEGFLVDCANDGLEGIAKFHLNSYDLIILDILMPKIDGFAALELIRKESNVPVIMLTALEEEESQIQCFDLQADDYISKPFSMNILIRRIKTLLRRSEQSIKTKKEKIITHHSLTLNLDSGEIQVEGKTIPVTHKEYELIKLFLENKGHLFTRKELLNKVWGYSHLGDETIVNGHVKNLRKKLGTDIITTVRGMGYKINE